MRALHALSQQKKKLLAAQKTCTSSCLTTGRKVMIEQVAAKYDAYAPFVESNPDASAEELRMIMDEQGYLFFRRLILVDAVLTVRHDVLEVLKEANWLDPEHDLMKGRALPGIKLRTEGQAEYTAVY